MKVLSMGIAVCFTALTLYADSAQERLKESTAVFQEIMATPDKSIPQDLLDKAQCMVIVPGLKKAAFVVGGKYGRGFVTCRHSDGAGWSAPAAIKIEGGSIGAQIGGQSTDLVMLVMNRRGMNKLMSDKFTLGADASIAAGPVGRSATAETDVKLSAEILSWSRSKGLFAGLSLSGATLRPDKDDNRELYGKELTTKDIVMTDMTPPADARPLLAELQRFSPAGKGASGGAERQAPPETSRHRKHPQQ